MTLDDISVLDRQIDQLYDYKPIPESEVKLLCDKVSQDFIENFFYAHTYPKNQALLRKIYFEYFLGQRNIEPRN